ncbi:MAG TPA: XkdF-like putative serine protease domain-containing protein, partial [Phycisphaerae bacterium]|nr:XkdF-like putative serine protease domain-containing protein [Phycisphaerae bacterium]
TPEAWAALTDSFIEYALESRSGDLDHAEWGAADLVEMAIFDAEKRSALGIPEGTLPDGVYVSFKARTSPAGRRLWQQVKEGTIRSLSIVGDGWREALEGEAEDDAETVV